MAKRLAGKVALVTGGSRGIGAATARALAEDGADVAISYAASAHKAEAVVRELEGKGVRAVAFQADQGDAAQVDGLVKAVAKRFGRLDILVNNAGVFVTGEVGDSSTDAGKFDRQFAVNVGGVAAAVRAAATEEPQDSGQRREPRHGHHARVQECARPERRADRADGGGSRRGHAAR